MLRHLCHLLNGSPQNTDKANRIVGAIGDQINPRRLSVSGLPKQENWQKIFEIAPVPREHLGQVQICISEISTPASHVTKCTSPHAV